MTLPPAPAGPPADLPLCPGDVLRLPWLSAADEIEPERPDEITIDYDPSPRSLARVVQVGAGDAPTLLDCWGRRFETRIHPLTLAAFRVTGWRRWLAPERLGEAAMARHLRRLRRGTGRAWPQPLTRALVLWGRGGLPGMQSLGGRWHPLWRRRGVSWLRAQMRARGWYPVRTGQLVHGTLIDGIGRDIAFT